MVALVFCDGFDKYGPAGNVNAASVLAGEWSLSGSATIVPPLSSTGYAFQTANNCSLTVTLPSSLTRIVGSYRFQIPTGFTLASMGFRALNSGTAVFSLTTSAAGAIEIRTGAINGTVISSAGSITLNTTHVLAFDVTIGAAAAYAIYLDNALLFSGTGNTGNGQTSLNQFGTVATAGLQGWNIDDLAIFNPLDPAYNSGVLTSGLVVETSFPSADAQKQFTNDGNVLWPTGIASNGVYRATGTVNNMTGNFLHLIKVTPVVNCTLNSVSMLPQATVATAKVRGVVYSDSSGSPGSLLSSGTEVIGVTGNAVFTGALTTPPTLTAGVPVWVGFILDSSFNVFQIDSSALSQRKANTYTGGAPASGSGMTAGQPTFFIWCNCTAATANFASELLNPPLGTAASQVHSNTVGQEDLYTFPALATTPQIIYGVAVKGFISKSDSGPRTVSLNMKSGVADSTGSNPGQTMSTTFQWQRSLYEVDPATGVAWTQSGVNAASSGFSVAS